MGFNETTAVRRRGLRFTSRSRRSESAVVETSRGAEGAEPPASPLAAAGEALASLYVTVARAVLLGVEALEDWRAESRAPVATRAPAAFSRQVHSDDPLNPQPARAHKTRSEPK
jgi:hypothetical protein